MRILHLTSHLGAGLGTVIMDWVKKENAREPYKHEILCLDYANEKAQRWAEENDIPMGWNKVEPKTRFILYESIADADIVVLHFYDHPMIYELLSWTLPPCRMVAWCHKNFVVPKKYLRYPDLFLDTSPIQGHGKHIWSTGNMDRFLNLEKKEHEGWNVGTILSPKLHANFTDICERIKKVNKFIFLGDHNPNRSYPEYFNFVGKVDDVAPYLAEMDIFLYPLKETHWGTCEQALGEAMSAGIPVVAMNNRAEREIIRHTYTGYLAQDEQGCVEGVEWILTFPGVYRHLQKNGRERAQILYDHDKMISQWNQVFEEMMKSRKTLKEPVAV